MIPKISGLNTAIDGIRKQGDRVEAAANNINKAFAAAQNAQAADSVSVSDKASVAPAVEDAVRGAVLSPEGEVTAALVDMLQASAAYKANIASAKVTGDIESDLMRLIGKHEA